MGWTMPAGARIGRVALRVNDVERMAAFYEQVVGLAVQTQRDDRAVLGVDGTPLLVLVADADAPARQPDATGLFHVAVRFPTRSALADALHRVEDHDALDGAADHAVSEALYLSDPEGNGIELYRDRPQEEWPVEDGMVGMPTRRLAVADLRDAGTGGTDAPAGTTVGHVHLEVADIAAARAFYVDTLGMTVRQELAGALFVAAGDYHHHVGLNTWNDRSQPAQGRGLAWYELLVPDTDTLHTLHARCDDTTPTDDGFRTHDPDNIQILVRCAP